MASLEKTVVYTLTMNDDEFELLKAWVGSTKFGPSRSHVQALHGILDAVEGVIEPYDPDWSLNGKFRIDDFEVEPR